MVGLTGSCLTILTFIMKRIIRLAFVGWFRFELILLGNRITSVRFDVVDSKGLEVHLTVTV